MRAFLPRLAVLVAIGAFACRGSDTVALPDLVELTDVTVDTAPQILERGSRKIFTATTLDDGGKKVAVPVAWRSSNERVARFERGGVLVALDTGTTAITATSLGVASPPVAVNVIWLGAARIAAGTWTRRNAASPNATAGDSVRAVVTNIFGAPVAGARVRFAIVDGGGSVSPQIATTGGNGVAAAAWTFGPAVGLNTVGASVVRDDGTPNPFVADNLVTFSLNTYDALQIVSGNDQSAQILSAVPMQPSVRLLDSLGVPRPGVPVAFVAYANGRVSTPLVSTDANGIASPGTWTLGDIPGLQLLEARAEDAIVRVRATGTGTPIYYQPVSVTAGGFSTCAIEADASVKCWGQTPQNGTGSNAAVSTPTTVFGAITATQLSGGPTHNCSLTAAGAAWCWGTNALVDTTGATPNTNKPTRLQSDIAWAQISPGLAHTCALDGAQTAYCWGDNSLGQLGDLATATRLVPGTVAGGFRFVQISSGTSHSCALSVSGSAFCWGSNASGEIGDGSTSTRRSPTAVAGGQTFQSVGAGEGFSCGLTTAGRVYCWGGIAGAVQTQLVTYPQAPTFVSLTVGGGHACALVADGTAYCWGNNAWGQVGDSSTTARSAPVAVAGGFRFAQLSAGYVHTCGRDTDGAVLCWGRNVAGELGDNTSSSRTTPRHIVLGVNP